MAEFNRVARGAVVSVVTRWADRALGLVSTLVLARLLAPNDFGVIAMASIAVGLVSVVTDLGVNLALLQKQDATRADFDTAWTMRIIQTSVASVALVGLAPFASDYFRDDRITSVIWAMTAAMFVGAFSNIGFIRHQKELRFEPELLLLLTHRSVSVLVTIIAAIQLRNFWAMVLGTFVSRCIFVGMSYRLTPGYRPRLSLSQWRPIFSFSQWTLVRNIGTFAESRLDKAFVGRHHDASTAGAYALADEIAALPTTELLAPLSRTLLPAFANLQDQPERLKNAYFSVLGVQALIGFPAGLGVYATAEQIVRVMLGTQWSSAVPFLEILALNGSVFALSYASGYLLIAQGRVITLGLLAWIQVGFQLALLPTAVQLQDPAAFGWIRLASTILMFFALSVLAARALSSSTWAGLYFATWRPLLASGAMVYGLKWVHIGGMALPLIELLLHVAVGVLIYGSALLLLWSLAGKPRGAETALMALIGERTKNSGPRQPFT
jgi:lipopolysaccharide exporter